VEWSAPSDDGRSPITGYTVTGSPSGTCTVAASARMCTITSLTNGTAYTFTVRATNAVGNSPASAASNSVTPTAVSATNYAAWTKSATLTLNTAAAGANVSGSVANFPVLVRLGSAQAGVFAQAKAGGADLRFSTAANENLPYQIEHWDATGMTATIWVKAKSVIGNTAGQQIKMYWGNAAADAASSGAAVFDTANGFRAVWHMNDAGDTTMDATASGFNAVAGTSAPTDTVGLIGKARRFNGTDQHFAVPNSAASELNFGMDHGYSVSAWANAAVVAVNNNGHKILDKGDNQYGLAIYNGSNPKYWEITTRGNNTWNQTTSQGAGIQADTMTNQWHHIMGVWDGAAVGQPVTQKLYLDGALVATSNLTNTSTQGRNTDFNVHIGTMGGGTAPGTAFERYWNGRLDEVILSKAARSAAWAKLSYENQRAAQTLVTVPAISAASAKPYATWTNSRAIVLNTSATGANVSGTVTNFPVLIRLGSTESAILSAANNGNSIRFTKADSTTILPYQIESWSSTAAAIWVKVDAILGNNATQSIRMYWGNGAAASESNAAAVFDTANGFVSVYHMNGAATEVNVAGHAALNATATGTVPAVSGLIGDARSYTGVTENYLSVPNSASGKLNFPASADYTLSAWVYSEETAIDNRGIFNKGNDQWLIGVYGGAEDKYYDLMTRGNNTWNQAATSLAGSEITSATGVGVWRHVVGVWKGSGTPQDTARIYINGVLANTTFFNDLTDQGRDTTANVYIGALWENGGLARPYHGRIDEVISSATFRDSNWVKLAFHNQKQVNSLVDIGNPVLAVPGAPASVTATPSTTTTGAIVVSWTAPASNGNANITAYNVTVASGTPNTATCATTGALTCTVTGLTAGNAYTFSVRATNSVGQGPAATSGSATAPTSILPGSFVIRMDGKTRPYSYRLPAEVAAVTEELTMTIIDVHGKKVWSKTVNPAANNIRELSWDGRNTAGLKVSAGMYVVRINAVANGQSFESQGKGVLAP
jgi:hypothetical protein